MKQFWKTRTKTQRQEFIVVLVVIGIVSLLVGYVYQSVQKLSVPPIPTHVLAKYEELSKEFNQSLGASLRLCKENGSGQKVFIVGGSGGFAGHDYYYTAKGIYLGQHYWTDTPSIDDIPPVTIDHVSCREIKRSETYLKTSID